MKDFLRRHAKILMGLLSIVLMAVFASPAFRQAKPEERSGQTAGYVEGKKITFDDLARAKAELDLLSSLKLTTSQKSPFVQSARAINFIPSDNDRPLYWMLLRREAEKYGYSLYNPSDAQQLCLQAGADPGTVAAMSPEEITAIVSALDNVENYIRALFIEPRPVAQLELTADRELRQVKVSYLTLDAASDFQQSPEPSAAELQKQFDAYKSTLKTTVSTDPTAATPWPAEVDKHHFPFGYKYPDRSSVEYVVFDRAAIQALFPQDAKDLEAAYQTFRKDNDAGVADGQPPMVWKDAQARYLSNQVNGRVTRQIRKMVEQFREKSATPWRGGRVPERAEWSDYAKIAQELSKTADYRGYVPQVKQASALLGAEDLAKLPEIGKAYFVREGTNTLIPFPNLATAVPELVTLDQGDPRLRLELRMGAEGPTLVDDYMSNGNFFVYRVVNVDKTHDPKSIDEVRPQVVEDCKKLAAYQKDVATLKSGIATSTVAKLAEQLKVKPSTPPAFSRVEGAAPPEVEAIRDFVKTAFSLEESASATPPVRMAVLENENSLRVYAIEFLDVAKASGKQFAASRMDLIRKVDDPVIEFVSKYLELAQLQARMKYKSALPT